jgi:mannose-6-phosphate isomerase-like protein (cupin superfamily)
MIKLRTVSVFSLAMLLTAYAFAAKGAEEYRVVTIIKSDELLKTADAAPADEVSDQAIRHVSSAEGNLGIGIVHRPVRDKGGPVTAILHHNQSEVYRVMTGSGTLVTSASMSMQKPLDEDGHVVLNLTGPSAVGIIDMPEHSQLIGAGDVVIIPAGLAHGFSEITTAITYMVVRIDPDRLVALK